MRVRLRIPIFFFTEDHFCISSDLLKLKSLSLLLKYNLEKKDEDKSSELHPMDHTESSATNLTIQTDSAKQSITTSVTQPGPTRGRPKGSTNAAIAAAALAAAAATSNPVMLPTNVTPMVSQRATSPLMKHQRKMNPPKVKDDKSLKSGSSKNFKSPNDKHSGPSLNVRVRRLHS